MEVSLELIFLILQELDKIFHKYQFKLLHSKLLEKIIQQIQILL